MDFRVVHENNFKNRPVDTQHDTETMKVKLRINEIKRRARHGSCKDTKTSRHETNGQGMVSNGHVLRRHGTTRSNGGHTLPGLLAGCHFLSPTPNNGPTIDSISETIHSSGRVQLVSTRAAAPPCVMDMQPRSLALGK